MAGPSFRLQTLAVFLAALLVRIVHLWQLRGSPFLEVYLGDAKSYHAWAQRLAGGDWLGTETFYQAPLYPYFLGVLYSLFGEGWIVRLVQAGLGSLACVFLALAGRRLLSERAGLIAGLGLALFPPAIFFDGLIQKSVLDNLLLCLLLWLVAERVQGEGRATWWLAVGGALGLLLLTRENAFVFLIPLAVWLGLERRVPARTRVLTAALLVAGLAVPLSPVAIRNYIVGGGLHLTTSQAGPNFFIGNNPEADGSYAPLLPGRGHASWERDDATMLAEQALGRELTPAEVSSYWTGRALDYIAEQPGSWLRLMAVKLALTWNAGEVEDSEDQRSHARWSAPLRLASVFHFGILAPLALLGVWITRDRWRRLWLFYAMTLIYSLSVALFFVFARYRYPLVPFLMLFAGAGLAGIWEFLRSAPRRELAICAAGVTAFAIFCNLPLVASEQAQVATLVNLGRAYEDRGDLEEAGSYYEEALQQQPYEPVALLNLGNVLQLQGRYADAIPYYRRSLAVDASNPWVWNNLGMALEASGDLDEALRHYRQALALNPTDPQATNNLAALLARRGHTKQAIERYEAAIAADPENVEARVNLGKVLANEGRLEEATRRFKEALQLRPGHAEIYRLLGVASLLRGDTQSAIAELELAVAFDPGNVAFRFDLGRALASRGDAEAAIPHLRLAAEAEPSPAHLSALSWTLATKPEASRSEGEEARRLAQRASELTGHRDPAILSTLAASQAAAGDFEAAGKTAARALELARAVGAERLVERLPHQMALYAQGRRVRADSDS